VRQQVTQRHANPCGGADWACGGFGGEAGKQLCQGRLQIEKAALMEQHGGGRGGGNLGDAGDVVDGFRGDGRGAFVICKAAQRLCEDNFVFGQHAEGATGKSMCSDGLVQDAVGGGKPASRAGWRDNGRSVFGFHRWIAS
jgi:hypothetical protein